MGCGFTQEDNRDSEQFHRQKYGDAVNADYNATKNIGLRTARKRTQTPFPAHCGGWCV